MIVLVGLEHVRHPAHDLDPLAREQAHLGRIVGQEAHPADPQLAQHGGCGPELPLVRLEAQMRVGVDRIQPAVLKGVGAELVGETDPAPLLGQVEQHAGTLIGHPADGAAKLVAAVAAERAQEVASEALGVHPAQGCLHLLGLAHDDGELLGPTIGRPERHHAHVLGIGQRYARLAHRPQARRLELAVLAHGRQADDDRCRITGRWQADRRRQQARELAELDRRRHHLVAGLGLLRQCSRARVGRCRGIGQRRQQGRGRAGSEGDAPCPGIGT
jgi:hypothetical protein